MVYFRFCAAWDILLSAGNRVYQPVNPALNMELVFFFSWHPLFLYCYRIYQGEEGEYLLCQKAKITGHVNYNEHIFKGNNILQKSWLLPQTDHF